MSVAPKLWLLVGTERSTNRKISRIPLFDLDGTKDQITVGGITLDRDTEVTPRVLDALRPFVPPGVELSLERDSFELLHTYGTWEQPSHLSKTPPEEVREVWAATRAIVAGLDADALFEKARELGTTIDWWNIRPRVCGAPTGETQPLVVDVIRDGAALCALLAHPSDEVLAGAVPTFIELLCALGHPDGERLAFALFDVRNRFSNGTFSVYRAVGMLSSEGALERIFVKPELLQFARSAAAAPRILAAALEKVPRGKRAWPRWRDLAELKTAERKAITSETRRLEPMEEPEYLVRALGKIGYRAAIPFLKELLATSDRMRARQEAFNALMRIDDDEARAAVLDQLDDVYDGSIARGAMMRVLAMPDASERLAIYTSPAARRGVVGKVVTQLLFDTLAPRDSTGYDDRFVPLARELENVRAFKESVAEYLHGEEVEAQGED